MMPMDLLESLDTEERARLESARAIGDRAAMHRLLREAARSRKLKDRSLAGKAMALLLARELQGPEVDPKVADEELARLLPYPLGWKLGGLLRDAERFEQGEVVANLIFDLFALISALLRISAVALLERYILLGATDLGVNRVVVDTLGQALVDERWRDMARHLARHLGARPQSDPLELALGRALRGAPLAGHRTLPALGPGPFRDLDYLVALRNAVTHGERIGPGYIMGAVAIGREVLRRFAILAQWRLVVQTELGGFLLEGELPTPTDLVPAHLPLDEPCLVPRLGDGQTFLSLSPLMRFRTATGEVALDELFFLNAATLDRLLYVGFRLPEQLDAQALGSYGAFRELMKQIPAPVLPRTPRMDFAEIAKESTRHFVGRAAILGAIEQAVAKRPAPYLVVRAMGGMGKTALFSRLHALHPPPRPERPERPERPATGAPGEVWIYHFCAQSEGRHSPVAMMRSLMAQAADAVAMPQAERLRYLVSADYEALRQTLFAQLLWEVAERLGPRTRLVLVVDALDEGFGAEAPVASALPAELPPNVVGLLSWRVDPKERHAHVERALEHITPAHIAPIKGADPMGGLTRREVQAWLETVRRQLDTPDAGDARTLERTLGRTGVVPPSVVETVWQAAHTPTGADPFFLRFLAQSAGLGHVDLERAESIPTSLDDAFEEVWLGLPTDEDFAIQRILLYLAVLREPATDEMMATFLNRQRPHQPLAMADIARLRISAGKLLVYHGERYSLFHERFRHFLTGDPQDPMERALAAPDTPGGR